jgi:hypothetical protein
VNNSNDEKIKKYNYSIPDELLVSLKQSDQPKEYIGPLTNINTNKQRHNGLNNKKPLIPVF